MAYNGVLFQEVPGNTGPTTVWALPSDGDFANGANWTTAAPPNSNETAIINNGTTATLTGTGSVANLETGVGYSDADGNVAVNGGNLSATGTVAIGIDGTGSLAVTNGGTVTDTTTVIGQNPGSNGTVTVDGAGSTLTSSGTTNVGEAGTGTLNITDGGAVISDGGTTVGPMGTLTGNGTITTPTLVNNGTVAPAGPNNTTGTLTVNGNYQQNPSGTLDAEIGGPDSSQADLLNVSGTAMLNGTLDLTSVNNFHPSPGDTYTILAAAGGLTGNFNQVLDSLNTSGLTLLVVDGPNGVLVSFLRPAPPPSPPQIVIATTPNPLPPPPLTNTEENAILVPILDPDAEELSSIYEIWFSGANTQRFNIEDRFDNIMAGSTGFVSNVSYPKPPPTGKELTEGKEFAEGKEGAEAAPSPLQPLPEDRWGVWVTGFGDFVNVDNDGSARGYNFTTGGVTIGIDYRLTSNFVIGLMGGYSHTWTDLNFTGSIDTDTGWGGAYAGYFDHGFYMDGAIFGGRYTFQSVRPALFGNANGSSDGSEFSTFVATGYDFHFGQLTIGPAAALQYAYASLSGFSERGSVAPLNISSDSQDSLRTDLGFRAWYDIHARQATVRPFLRAAWEHEYLYSALPISANLVDIPSSPVAIFGPNLGHDSAVINAGLSVQWSPRLSTYVSYDGQLGRARYDSNGVSGGIRYTF